MNKDSYNMGFVPCNFDPEYSVDEINSYQQLSAESTAHPSPFSVQLQLFFRMLTTHLKYCFGFLLKIYV